MPKLRIAVGVGMTVSIRSGGESTDWLKPTVRAELSFDEVPDENELRDKWRWLWESQVGPQSDELIDLLVRELSKRGVPAERAPEHGTY